MGIVDHAKAWDVRSRSMSVTHVDIYFKLMRQWTRLSAEGLENYCERDNKWISKRSFRVEIRGMLRRKPIFFVTAQPVACVTSQPVVSIASQCTLRKTLFPRHIFRS